MTSLTSGGALVGAVIAGLIADKHGRKLPIWLACVVFVIGTALQTGVTGFGMLIAGRVINGVCVGITSSQVPVYLAEISRKEKRGTIIIIQQLAIGKRPTTATRSIA